MPVSDEGSPVVVLLIYPKRSEVCKAGNEIAAGEAGPEPAPGPAPKCRTARRRFVARFRARGFDARGTALVCISRRRSWAAMAKTCAAGWRRDRRG